MMNKPKIDFSPGSPARKQISIEFYCKRWEPFRTWFFSAFTKQERTDFQNDFYKDLSKEDIMLAFVPWFMIKYVGQYLSVIEHEYHLSGSGDIVISALPPTQSFDIFKDGKTINFTAFSKLFRNDGALLNCEHINLILRQQNYANYYLTVLGEHIMSLHKNLDNYLKQSKSLHEKIDSFTKKHERIDQKVVKNTLQPPPEVKNFKTESSGDIEQLLLDKLKNIDLSSHVTNLDLQPQPVLSAQENDFISQQAKHDFSVNRINTKWADKPIQRMYYYNRPTPIDILNEERDHTFSNSYNSREIYEWNIDGFNDKQIFTTVHRMLMYSTICKVNKNSDKDIASMIVSGFTGQLKGWWDNFLNETQRTTIMNTTKVSKIAGQLAYETAETSTADTATSAPVEPNAVLL